MEHGRILFWKIGNPEPIQSYSDSTFIDSVAVSPDGMRLVSVAEQGYLDDDFFIIRCRDSHTGELLAMTKGKGHAGLVAFDPQGRFVGVTTLMSFDLFDARTLELVIRDDRPNEFQRSYRPNVQPPLFPFSSKAELQVLGLGKRWLVSDGRATLLNQYSDQPDALGPDSDQGFFALNAGYDESAHFLLKEAGILISSFDQKKPNAFIRFDPSAAMFGQLAYIPPSDNRSRGYLVADKIDRLYLLDLEKRINVSRWITIFRSVLNLPFRQMATSDWPLWRTDNRHLEYFKVAGGS